MREYLLPSVFLSSAASHFLSLSSSLVARKGSKMRERAFAVIGGSFGSVWTNDDLPSFPSSRLLYIYDNGGDRFDEVSRAKQRFSVAITLCLLLRGKSVILEITVFTYVCVRVAYRSFYLFDRESRYFIVSCSRSFLVTLIQEVYEPYQCRA